MVLICYAPSHEGRSAPEVWSSLGHPISGSHKYGDLSSRSGFGREDNKSLSVKYYVTRNLKKNRKQSQYLSTAPKEEKTKEEQEDEEKEVTMRRQPIITYFS